MKSVVIVLCAYKLEGTQPRLEFHYHEDTEMYLISSVSSFKDYVVKLLSTAGQNKITVVAEYTSNGDYFQLVEFVKQHTLAPSPEHVCPSTTTSTTTSTANKTPIDLVSVLWDTYDPLSVKTLYLQQILRVIACIWGGSFVCIEPPPQPPTAGALASKLVAVVEKLQACAPPAQPVYDATAEIRLFVPKGWDSWSKIKLLASTSRFSSSQDQNQLLSDDADYDRIARAYAANELASAVSELASASAPSAPATAAHQLASYHDFLDTLAR